MSEPTNTVPPASPPSAPPSAPAGGSRPGPPKPPVAKPAGTALQMAPTPSPVAAPAPPQAPVEVKGPVSALLSGFVSAWACRRLLLFVLVLNLAAAALLVLPLYGPMNSSLSLNPEAARIGRNLDYRWWTDWTWKQQDLVAQSVGLLGAGAFLTVLLSTFLAGGVLEALRQGAKPPLAFEPLPDPFYKGALPEWRAASPGPGAIQTALRNSARHFPRFLAYLLLSVPFYWAAQVVLNRVLLQGLDRFLEGVTDERVGLALTTLRAILFVAAFDAVTVFFEYVRVSEVLKPGTPLLALLARPVALLRARGGTLVGIEAGAFILQIVAMLAFIPVDAALSGRPLLAVTLGLLAMEAFVFLRFLIRASAHAAQLHLARSVPSRV